jgi:hypothetical protein
MEVVGLFYGHLVYFTAIWYILLLFGIFSPFWYVVPRKIWQLWSAFVSETLGRRSPPPSVSSETMRQQTTASNYQPATKEPFVSRIAGCHSPSYVSCSESVWPGANATYDFIFLTTTPATAFLHRRKIICILKRAVNFLYNDGGVTRDRMVGYR